MSRPNAQFLEYAISRKDLLQAAFAGFALLILISRIIHYSTSVIASPITERLWGISQECNFEIKKAQKSLDGPTHGFDGKTASCKRENDTPDFTWTYTQFESSNLQLIQNIQLEIGFNVTNWQAADVMLLQASDDHGNNWVTVAEFNAEELPPTELTILDYDLGAFINFEGGLDSIQIQLISPGQSSGENELELLIDEAVLIVSGEVTPTETQTATQTQWPTFSATPTDAVLPPPTLTVSSTMLYTPTSISTEPDKPTETLTSTATPSEMVTATTTYTPSITVTITSSATITPTLPAATVTPIPQATLVLENSNQVEELWGIEQVCDFGIDNPKDSIDASFNDRTASCSGNFAADRASWQFTSIQDSAFTHISDAILEIRFAFCGWVDDQINLEIFDGSEWQLLESFDPTDRVPPNELSTFSFPVGSVLRSAEALNTASVRFIGVASNAQVDLISIQVDAMRLRVAGGYPSLSKPPAMATPSVALLAMADASVPGDPHGDHSLLTDSCAACHRSHSSSGEVIRQEWPEEAVCLSCHSSAGPGTNVIPPFVNLVNSATRYFKHDVSLTSGQHQAGEQSSANFGGGNRHVECEDCHDPHNAARGQASAPMLPFESAGISGVDPVWNGPGEPGSYTWLAQAEREYQVCFKCHSSFTSLPSYSPDGWNGSAYIADGLRKLTNPGQGQVSDSRDLAREFNPSQASFHPVVAQGRNQSIPAGSFVNGWSQSSMLYCTDCHNNPNASVEGSGPHGSPWLHILKGGANYSTVYTNGSSRVSSGEVCFNCHSYDVYMLGEGNNTNFEYHKKHLDNNWGTTCYTCHDTHGSEQLHLINFDASAMTFTNDRNSQTAWYYDPATGRAGCYLSCHGESHNPKEYTP